MTVKTTKKKKKKREEREKERKDFDYLPQKAVLSRALLGFKMTPTSLLEKKTNTKF